MGNTNSDEGVIPLECTNGDTRWWAISIIIVDGVPTLNAAEIVTAAEATSLKAEAAVNFGAYATEAATVEDDVWDELDNDQRQAQFRHARDWDLST